MHQELLVAQLKQCTFRVTPAFPQYFRPTQRVFASCVQLSNIPGQAAALASWS